MIAGLTNTSSDLPTGCRQHVGGFTFRVPESDEEFFTQRVMFKERLRVRDVLAALREIADSPKVIPACRRLAGSLQRNWQSLRADFYAYTSAGRKKGTEFYPPGDWRTILNWSKVRSEKVHLPFAFLEFWRGLGEKNQRNWKSAWGELMQIIGTARDFQGRTYKKIPGFADWPVVDPVFGWPAGMSYSNLMNHTSDPYDASLARHGRSKASALRLPVLKTRTTLVFGQFIEFDDHEFNQKTLFQKKPMRPLGFGADEVLTDCLFQVGFKPTLWDDVEEVRRKLTEREFMWFTMAVLCGTGIRRDEVGTTFVGERGMATWRSELQERIARVTHDQVKFYVGTNAGNNVRAAHKGQFDGKPKGNFRTKRLIESKWNAIDNQTASLLGQVGKDRDHAPAQLHGAEQYVKQLQRAAGILPAEHTSDGSAGGTHGSTLLDLRYPFHPFLQWRQFALDAVQRINCARDHALEGWEKLGFVNSQWRSEPTSEHWLTAADFEVLDALTKRVLAVKLEREAALRREVRLHRWEVFCALKKQLTPVGLHHLPELVGRENALNGGAPLRVGSVVAGTFAFDCEEIDPDTIYFYARDQRERTNGFLQNGEKYVCFVNPYLPTHLVACDEDLRVQAVCPRYDLARDEAGLKTAMGKQRSYEAAAEVRLNLRHADDALAKRAMREHNDRVLRETGEHPERGPRNAEQSVADCTAELLARESAPLESE